MDPRIRIRIRTKISWIRNTAFFMLIHFYVYFAVAGVPTDGATEDRTQGTRYSSLFLCL